MQVVDGEAAKGFDVFEHFSLSLIVGALATGVASACADWLGRTMRLSIISNAPGETTPCTIVRREMRRDSGDRFGWNGLTKVPLQMLQESGGLNRLIACAAMVGQGPARSRRRRSPAGTSST